VDLEFSGPNFRGFDLGDFFYGLAGNYFSVCLSVSWGCFICTGFDVADFNVNMSTSIDYQLTWLRMYLEETVILQGQ